MATPKPTTSHLRKGFGAGAGAALALILVMALLRLLVGVPSIPELLQGAFLRLVPGDLFELLIHQLGAGAKVLLLVATLEGMLLAGAGLGGLFVRLWRPRGGPVRHPRRAARYGSGLLYGLLIGAMLIVCFFLIDALGIMNPEPQSSVFLPVVLSLFGESLVFGLALAALLPWPVPGVSVPPAAIQGDARRQFLRLAGGTLLALGVGAGLWGVLARVLAEPEPAALVPQDLALAPAGDVTATPARPAATAAQATVPATTPLSSPAAPPQPMTATAVPPPTPPPIADGGPSPAPPIPAAVPPASPAGTQTPAPGTPNIPPTNTPLPATPLPTAPPPTLVPTDPPATPTPVPTASATPFPAVPVLVPEITPTANFYITTKNWIDPQLEAKDWSLTVAGLVQRPRTFTFAAIRALPPLTVAHTLECISNPVGGTLIGNARWTGVRVADLLMRARPLPAATTAVLRGADDYSDSVPVAALLQPGALLVYAMNDQPLSAQHGYPARLLVPGIFGMKNVKWLTGIELITNDYQGYWQTQGWSGPAPYLTMSRIDYPQAGLVSQKPLYIGGIAFAGNRGIRRVEVSVDAGQTWADAQVRRPLSPNAWVLWTYPWVPTRLGATTLVVRATDGGGQVQTATEQNNFPNGATGYHKVKIRVVPLQVP